MKRATETPRAAGTARLAREAREALRGLADPEHARFMAGYLKTRHPVLGARVPKIRASVRLFQARHRDLALESALAMMDAFAKSAVREELLFGSFLLARFRRLLDRAVWPRIEGWIEAVDNWETCDQMASNVAAEVVAREPALAPRLVRWARSRNPWRRRFAAAITTRLNHGGRSFVAGTLRVCEPLMEEEDDGVAKAVGWALREAAKQDPVAVATFLLRWREKARRSILREASEKPSGRARRAILGPS